MSDTTRSVTTRRPAEALTGAAGAAVAIVVATTGLSTELSTALVIVVGALPGVVTAVVSVSRSTASGGLLVGLTPEVASLAGSTLKAARDGNVPLTEKTATLKNVAESVASWTAVLAAEPGASASGGATKPAVGAPPGGVAR